MYAVPHKMADAHAIDFRSKFAESTKLKGLN